MSVYLMCLVFTCTGSGHGAITAINEDDITAIDLDDLRILRNVCLVFSLC